SINSEDTGGAGSGASSPQQIFVYDNYPGGIGFSAPLYGLHGELLAGTRRLIAECPCENGCPGCVGPVGNTGPLAKVAALRILDLITTAGAGRMETAGISAHFSTASEGQPF